MICHNPITGPNEASPVTPATPPRETWPWLQRISDTFDASFVRDLSYLQQFQFYFTVYETFINRLKKNTFIVYEIL